MGTIKTAAKEASSELRENTEEFVKGHANFLTIAIALIILISGLGIVQGRNTWWLSAAAIACGFLILFFFLNARVFIKAAITGLSLIFSANLALQAGVIYNNTNAVGLLWTTAQIFLCFALIAISYLWPGHRSRWTGATLTLWFSLLSTATYATILPFAWALLASLATCFLFFTAYYRGLGRINEHRNSMPIPQQSQIITDSVAQQCENAGWQYRTLEARNGFRGGKTFNYLVWNETHAYLLHPVKLAGKFGIAPTRRQVQLTHRGSSINPWLLNLAHRSIPLWRSRNASIMLVLLDVESTNGVKPEAIGVSMPDTKKKLAVGIYPAKAMLTPQKKPANVLTSLEAIYSPYLRELTPKQLKALAGIGVKEGSSYLDS